MIAHELMIKTNHYLIKSGALTVPQKTKITSQLLNARSDEKTKQSFYKGVNKGAAIFTGNPDAESSYTYPFFYIPPYNDGKKLQTVIPLSPKTHILSANSYELEILRLLFLFEPQNSEIKNMTEKTSDRLKNTCFGYHDCAVGECFHSALIVLRFLAAVKPEDEEWIVKLLNYFKRNMDNKLAQKNKGVHGNVIWYYRLCLSELPYELAKSEILRYKDMTLNQLNRSYVMNSEKDKINHPVMLCAIRNCISRLPEFEHIKNIQPTVSDEDGRLYFKVKSEK